MALDSRYAPSPSRSPSPSPSQSQSQFPFAALANAASQSASLACPPRLSRLSAPYHHPLVPSRRSPTHFFLPAPFSDRARAITDMFLSPNLPWLRTLAFATLTLALLLLLLYPTSLAQHLSISSTQRPHGLIFESDKSSSLQLDIVSSQTLQSSDLQNSKNKIFNPPPSKIEIERRILAAAPILGYFEESNGSFKSSLKDGDEEEEEDVDVDDEYLDLANWMSSIPDQISLTQINIPGTHDSATWNYTSSTQLELEPITGKLPPSIAYQCQDRSLFRMLGDGIRFFDLRVGYLPGHQQLGFYHAAALLSTTATVPDVFLGFYKWLDAHPTETVLVSIKVDNATFGEPSSAKQPSRVGLQEMLYELLTEDELGKKYWLQQDKTLGTLGEARGKLIFIQRIDWTTIRSRPSTRPIGIPLPPNVFKDNLANFSIIYNPETGARAMIEDLYNLPGPNQPVQKSIMTKLIAIEKNLIRAACDQVDQVEELFITFTSGGALRNLPPVTPKMLALGTSTIKGVNQRLQQILESGNKESIGGVDKCSLAQQRLGIVILDWYAGVDNGLVKAMLRRKY